MGEKFDLGAYLKQAVPDSGTMPRQIETIDIGLIDSDERNFYELSGVEALAANIQLCGLQQPLLVRPSPADPNRVVIVSGHRRRAALELLAKDDPKWRQVEVIRETAPGSEALQELKLIFANNDTRRMTSSELANQVAKVEQLLYQLKEDEGMEFPGRMRDHVAAACKVTKTKLSNLKVIREKLIPEAKKAWEKNDLTEDAALKLARLPESWQKRIVEGYKKRNNGRLKWLYASAVEHWGERYRAIDKLQCQIYGCECTNRENKMAYVDGQGSNYYGNCHQNCCSSCDKIASCKYVCPLLSSEVRAAKEQRRMENAQAKADKEAKERPDRELLELFWARFKDAREKAGATLESVFGPECWDTKYASSYIRDFEKLEGGNITASSNTPFRSYGGYLSDAKMLLKLAKFLDCSVDYLLCRTSEPNPEQVKMAVPAGRPQWRTDDPPEGARVLGKFDVGEGLRPTLSVVYFHDGLYWLDKNWSLDYDLPLLGWSPIPED